MNSTVKSHGVCIAFLISSPMSRKIGKWNVYFSKINNISHKFVASSGEIRCDKNFRVIDQLIRVSRTASSPLIIKVNIGNEMRFKRPRHIGRRWSNYALGGSRRCCSHKPLYLHTFQCLSSSLNKEKYYIVNSEVRYHKYYKIKMSRFTAIRRTRKLFLNSKAVMVLN